MCNPVLFLLVLIGISFSQEYDTLTDLKMIVHELKNNNEYLNKKFENMETEKKTLRREMTKMAKEVNILNSRVLKLESENVLLKSQCKSMVDAGNNCIQSCNASTKLTGKERIGTKVLSSGGKTSNGRYCLFYIWIM